MQTLREHKCQPRMLYPANLSITIDEETKAFHDKNKFTKYLSTNTALQRLINGKYQQKEGSYILENQEVNLLSTNPKEDNHTSIKITSKLTGSNNHYSLTSMDSILQ